MAKNQFMFWGCDFDPNPDMNGIRRKLSNFLLSEGNSRGRGPYDILYAHKTIISDACGLFAGKYPCPSWLSVTPDFAREIYPENYRAFINNGGCRDLAFAFGEHVRKKTPQERIPITLGVDHCITGGLYRALAESGSDIILVILDQHLDALSPYCRNRMVGYSREHEKKKQKNSVEYYGPDFRGDYDTGSFLHYLIKDQVLKPKNLLVLGNQDAPAAKLRNIKDSRITGYLDEYDSMLANGATIVPLKELRKQSFYSMQQELQDRLANRRIYLSVDIDVFDGVLGRSSRYSARDGLSFDEVARLLNWLGISDTQIIGMDIMELDINVLREHHTEESEIAACFEKLIQLAFSNL